MIARCQPAAGTLVSRVMLQKFRNMTKWGMLGIIAVFLLTIVLEWGANISGKNVTPYAVKVNGDEISFEEIDRAYGQQMEKAVDVSETEQQTIYASVVDELIAQRLALQEAHRLRLDATSQEIVEQTRERLFRNEQGQLDMERFKRARRDLPAAQWAGYEKVIGQDITQWKIYNWIAASVVVTPGELRDYYNLRYQRALLRHILIRPGSFIPEAISQAFYASHSDTFMIAERVRGRHILFRLPQNATPDAKIDARSRAEAVLLRINSGESFNKLYAEAKADTGAPVLAEELDWFSRGQMVAAFDSVAFIWPTGRPTEIIETEFGYHIALFDAHEMPHVQPYAEVAEGIRAKLAGDSEIRRARELAKQLHGRLVAGEDFAALAGQYSSGKSAAQGGLLGEVIPGEMTPELYPDSGSLERIGKEVGNFGANRSIILDPAITRAVFDLEVGKISDVIQSGHGFHVMRIERRRAGDPTLWSTFQDRTESEYREFLKKQIYQDWITKVKARATIEYAESVRTRLHR